MAKSETWPGGTGLEMMNGMDSAGSCDSVVSANSGFSDDSLEHLSAEEKACLMFLEETIDSLDTEEDSGLSNDEPDQLPAPGSLATKLADLSASMSNSKLKGSQKLAPEEPIKKNFDAMFVQSYLVPTPFVVANNHLSSVSSTKPGTPADKILYAKPHLTSENNIQSQKQIQKPVVPPLPIEINVVIPASMKSRDYSVRTSEGSLPRGPLSYEALVYLRKNASTKKTPLCPTIDHTIDLDKGCRGTADVPNYGNLPRSIKSHSEVSKSKKSPPAVAPKPKKIPANKTAKPQNKVSVTSDSSYRVKRTPDPEVVRLEALQKLGLLKDQEGENETVAPLPSPKSHTSLIRFTTGPPNCNPPRNPLFCYAQVPTEHKNRSLQSSASFHHYSRGDQQPLSHPQTNGVKRAGLERSATLDNHRNSENSKMASAKPVKTTTVAQHVPHEPANIVGYTVMVVPGMGADRKEALRKLGLLKD